jgi:hypothetical protein
MGRQERHGAGSAQGASADVFVAESEGGSNSTDRGLECEGDVVRSDIMGLVVGRIGAQWGGQRRIVLFKVPDPASNQLYRADKGVATEAKTDDFATYSILLSGEYERYEGGAVLIVFSGQRG